MIEDMPRHSAHPKWRRPYRGLAGASLHPDRYIAKKVGIGLSALMGLEIEGQSPDPDLLTSIATALGVPAAYMTIPRDSGHEVGSAHNELVREA